MRTTFRHQVEIFGFINQISKEPEPIRKGSVSPSLPEEPEERLFHLTCTCGSSERDHPAELGQTRTEVDTEEVVSLTAALEEESPSGPGHDGPRPTPPRTPAQVPHSQGTTQSTHLHRYHTVKCARRLTCSSAFTLSSSQPTSSRTSSVLRLRNSSDKDTSTKCWWRKLLAESYSVVHIIVSANCRTPRQFLGCNLRPESRTISSLIRTNTLSVLSMCSGGGLTALAGRSSRRLLHSAAAGSWSQSGETGRSAGRWRRGRCRRS